MTYNWEILHDNIKDIYKLKQQDLHLSDEAFNEYIKHNGKLRNPFLLKNMDRVIDRLHDAILSNERICICGDYDVDGITATTVMALGLLQLTNNITFSIPDRVKDGYGLSIRQIDDCIANNVDLIITVDTGIAEHESIAYAQRNNIDVIVTDHHPWNSDILPCELVIDPFIDKDYPFPYICGAMVAYKVIRALIPNLKKINDELNQQLIALTAIATIADVMALIDENRLFVYHGLKLINDTTNFGLNALLKCLNLQDKEVTESDVGFSIAPCMNAVGRLEHAGQLVTMFLADDSVESEKIAAHAVRLNEKRKRLQEEVMTQLQVSNEPVIIQEIKHIPAGMLGIIANKIAHKYQRPCFALTYNNGYYGGSGRSIFGYDISRNILNSNDLDINGGGHSEACALRIAKKDLECFKQRCNEDYIKYLDSLERTATIPTLYVDFLISFRDITEKLMTDLEAFRPFGQQNNEILFCSKKVEVLEHKVIGKKKNALRLQLKQLDLILPAICFNELKDYYMNTFSHLSYIDIVYKLTFNEFKGKKTIQLMPIDFKESEVF